MLNSILINFLIAVKLPVPVFFDLSSDFVSDEISILKFYLGRFFLCHFRKHRAETKMCPSKKQILNLTILMLIGNKYLPTKISKKDLKCNFRTESQGLATVDCRCTLYRTITVDLTMLHIYIGIVRYWKCVKSHN